ncbi:zinc-dependent alcohol dehydrogenase [Aquipseudomonas ullengensis]|nr:zinc-binding dehydrogenase [Pseudomonas ullengensis]
MKQVRLYGPQDLRIDEVPMPQAGPRDVVVKVAVFGICGSDLNFARNGYIGSPSPQPIPLGHELAGTVHQVGEAVQDIAVGQRVVIHPMKGSNRIGTGDPVHGGFAEFLLVRDAALDESVFPIPDHLAFERAVLTEPVAVGVHGLNLCQAEPSDRVVLFGAGPIGLGVVAALKHRGVERIAVVDIIDERLERARQLGADQIINPAKEELEAALRATFGTVPSKITGQPLVNCSLYIDCAGQGALLQQAVVMAKDTARILILATHKQPVELDMVQVLIKELAIRGSLSYPDEFPEVLAMLGDERLVLEGMHSHSFDFDRFAEAFAMAQDPHQSAKVLVQVS